ncbi:MAG: hypothetical protein ACRD1L_08455 [Terriglobales bacterium]
MVLVESVDFFRADVARRAAPEKRAGLGQFLTPPATAKLMASMFQARTGALSLLDPGAGVGSLTAGFVAAMCGGQPRPESIRVTAVEIDPDLCDYLGSSLQQSRELCNSSGVAFEYEIVLGDFLAVSATVRARKTGLHDRQRLPIAAGNRSLR